MLTSSATESQLLMVVGGKLVCHASDSTTHHKRKPVWTRTPAIFYFSMEFEMKKINFVRGGDTPGATSGARITWASAINASIE